MQPCPSACARALVPPLASSLILLLAACAAPERRELSSADLAAELDARAVDPAALASALADFDVGPLDVPIPAPPQPAADGSLDPEQAGFWHASAYLYNARTRAARHALLAARAAARSAGAPMPVEAMLEVEELERPDDFTRLNVTFDLLGILGLGPAAAAVELADARVRVALAELEQAVWDARIGVDRARARLAAVRGELNALLHHLEASQTGLTRMEILASHGRLGEEAVASARLVEHFLLHAISGLEAEEAGARADLALAAGLPVGHAALDAVDSSMLAALEPASTPDLPGREVLLARAPALRLGMLAYALAEADVREVALRRWPTLEVGPSNIWLGSEYLLGLLANTSIPWPGSLEGELDAALERRAARGAELADRLLEVEARARAARERLEAARASLEEHARKAEFQSALLWRGARARFQVDPEGLMNWSDALQMRAEAIAELFAARLDAADAALELESWVGPRAAAQVEEAQGQPAPPDAPSTPPLPFSTASEVQG